MEADRLNQMLAGTNQSVWAAHLPQQSNFEYFKQKTNKWGRSQRSWSKKTTKQVAVKKALTQMVLFYKYKRF